ncbi:MAG: methyl-accepting chemotaxis protein [Deltaproteobacteria bacterium]|nr:methyl-accepting chemotaxis protein [Deltaproteobacteria bacterium]
MLTRLSISKKLLGGFLVMAILVVVTGAAGVMMVKKVARSGRLVVEEKVPAKDVVMKAEISLGQVIQSINELVGADEGLQKIEGDLAEWLGDVDMWLSMLALGTESPEFKNSPAGKMYAHDQMTIKVPPGGEEVKKRVAALHRELKKVKALVDQIALLSGSLLKFRFDFDGVHYTMPAFVYHVKDVNSRWLASLQKTVNSYQENFSGLLDPRESEFDRWLAGFQNDDEELQELLDACKQANDALYEMGRTIMAAPVDQHKIMFLQAVDDRLAAFNEAFTALQEYVEEEYDSLKSEQFLDLQDLREVSKGMYASLGTLESLIDNDIQAALAESRQTANASLWLVAMMAAGSVVLAVILGLLITRGITRPLAKVVDFADQMAAGDFTRQLEVRQQDEVGILAEAFNKMVANLKTTIVGIMNGVETLASSSTQLNAIAGRMADGAQETASRSNAVASAAEEMNTNMNTVAAAMEEAATNVATVASGAEQMNATIGEIAKNATNAREITGQAVAKGKSAATRINELVEAAREIGKVTETINAISSQTNLLALNATIEAARAGEAGKGFAVVANEIKELAQQTAAATGEIAARIKGIQDSTGATVGEIEEIARINGQVDEIVATIAVAVDEQSSTTAEIAENVAQAAQGIGEVNENVAQTTEVAGTIAHDIAEVNEAAGEMSNASAQVSQSSTELSRLAEKLREMTSRFKVQAGAAGKLKESEG